MKKRLKIGIDMDGVVVDFVSAFRREAEALLQRPFPSFSSDWDFSNWKLTPEEYESVWQKIRDSENWFMTLPGLPTASEEVPRLWGSHEVYFISTRMQTRGFSVKRQTEVCLAAIFGVQFPTVIVTKDKGPVSSALQLDLFIDDKVENLQRIRECSSTIKLFLMNQVYNEEFKAPSDWIRVNNLSEFRKRVDEL